MFFPAGEIRELPEHFIQRWRLAAKRRGLALAVWTEMEPEGIIMQSYLPTRKKPPRPAGVTYEVTPENRPDLFCPGCKQRYTPREKAAGHDH